MFRLFQVYNLIVTQVDEIWMMTSIFFEMEFFSMQPRLLVFGTQHCFNPTRWNIEEDLHFFENGRQCPFFLSKRKTT
jgi:hypothetical protein